MKTKLYTGNEAAVYLGVHPQTVKNWRKSGKLTPAIERENLTLYDAAYLDEIKENLQKKKKSKKTLKNT